MAAAESRAVSVVVLFACLFFLASCFPRSTAPVRVEFYTLDYAPPVAARGRLDQVIRFDRFSVVQSYNSPAMVYRPEAYRLAVYQYHRWRTGPGEMVTDYLVRDFRSSGLFQAVFSYRQPEDARFEVDGAVEEFLESREEDGWKAILGLAVTLLDRSKPEITSRVMFQKRYRAIEPISDQSPGGFARGMSAAMARLSAEIMGDVADATGRADQVNASGAGPAARTSLTACGRYR
jgi:ABC-type uncharacterized transport system auxiliary subunit